MNILLTGLAIFILIHLLPTSPRLRGYFISKLGYFPYLAIFSAISLAGFVLLIYGYSTADRIQLYQPSLNALSIARVIMPLAFILIIAAYLKTYLRAKLKHPMLIGTTLWALVHLLANGDNASVALFGGFLLYAVLDMLMAKPRSSLIAAGAPSLTHDVVAIFLGMGAYVAVLQYHQLLFGVALSSAS